MWRYFFAYVRVSNGRGGGHVDDRTDDARTGIRTDNRGKRIAQLRKQMGRGRRVNAVAVSAGDETKGSGGGGGGVGNAGDRKDRIAV